MVNIFNTLLNKNKIYFVNLIIYFLFIFCISLYAFLVENLYNYNIFFKCLMWPLYFLNIMHYLINFINNIFLNFTIYTPFTVEGLFYEPFLPLNNIMTEFYINIYSKPYFFFFAILFLLTAFLSFIFLNYLGLYGAYIVNFIAIVLFWITLLSHIKSIFIDNVYYYINVGSWMYLNNNFRITFDFFIDNVSLSFSFLTLTIAVFVYIYTFSYFRYEPLVERLFILLNLFVISMIFLVSSANWIMLFLGWEMIGLTSFFLINFWVARLGTLKAAFKAYSFNKLSDMLLFFAILLCFNLTYNLDILSFITSIHLYENYKINILWLEFNYLEILSFCLLGSAFIKSAQLGTHIWLPDSMEAPVPASALIHSATLVSAGIFLLIRFTTLFEMTTFAYSTVAIVGTLTAFYGGFVSMYQSDTKRILAYSTISHCGFLMVIYTTGVFEYLVLYLYVHGFFKAATFLCVGNIIRFSHNIQDFKKMGSFSKYLTFDCLACFICLLNLGGAPLTFGFFIKHTLFIGLQHNFVLYYFLLIVITMAAVTGLFYSSKLFYYVFFDIKKAQKATYSAQVTLNLYSKYYSNTTLASTIAISLLIFVSYFITIWLVYNYINVSLFYSDVISFINNISNLYWHEVIYSYLFNLSYINWILLFLAISLIFTSWRKLNDCFSNYNNVNRLFVFILFLFFILSTIL